MGQWLDEGLPWRLAPPVLLYGAQSTLPAAWVTLASPSPVRGLGALAPPERA
jgi:hypothetical protein